MRGYHKQVDKLNALGKSTDARMTTKYGGTTLPYVDGLKKDLETFRSKFSKINRTAKAKADEIVKLLKS